MKTINELKQAVLIQIKRDLMWGDFKSIENNILNNCPPQHLVQYLPEKQRDEFRGFTLSPKEKLIQAFTNTKMEESEWVELFNLDRAKLVLQEDRTVAVLNEHNTIFEIDELDEIEILMFLQLIDN